MFVGKIVRNHPVRDFHGYADEGAGYEDTTGRRKGIV